MHFEPGIVKRYGGRALTMAVLVAVYCLLTGHPALGRGLVLGTLASVANFWMMAVLLPLRLTPSRRKSFLVGLISLVLRYGLMGAAVVAAVESDRFQLPGVAAGLLAVPGIILLDNVSAGRNRSG